MINKYSDEQVRELLDDPVLGRIAKVIDKASLSILELLEYGITQKEINHALANGIISFDKTSDRSGGEYGAPTGDYYFRFLNSKVKLTDLGLTLLQHILDK